MRVAMPGKMQDFATLKGGDLFLYFVSDSQHWGMLTVANDLTAPISFTEPIGPGLPTPCVHDMLRFENGSVLVIEQAEARFIWPQTFLDGSPPPHQGIGAIIRTETSTMVRIKGTNNNWDVDLTNGNAQRARVHPGSITIVNWEIGFWENGTSFKEILKFP
ncbi:hypothetical protein ACQR1V_05010 [Bradyrhizobium oligotrophicum]|uniref:hypothetical protein n=1 Tax=Bradyrhizobium oligotrophicum TaxID=44255 RepID=UPI003EBC9DBB